MNFSAIQAWLQENPALAIVGLIAVCVVALLIARNVIARWLIRLSERTQTKYDDILIKNVHPYWLAWLAPLAIIYFFAYLFSDYQPTVEKVTLVIILWIGVLVLDGLLDALNQIYESTPSYTGVSIQGYLDIAKILVIAVGLILSFSILTGKSPVLLLGGLTAVMAVLLLIFRDTLLSIVASVQISTNDLIKEGDWLEIPSYDVDGDVINISLHSIKVQNFDQTISVVPPYKLMEVAYKNWRGMQESGGRRIKRSIYVDLGTLRFCDSEMVERYRKVDILQPYLETRLRQIEDYMQENREGVDFPLDGPMLTNVAVYQAYIEAYLRAHPGIHSEDKTLLVRQLDPRPQGLPVEVYAFTRTVDWIEYEAILAEIFSHLLAAAPFFDLRVFQEPTGLNFEALAKTGQSPINTV